MNLNSPPQFGRLAGVAMATVTLIAGYGFAQAIPTGGTYTACYADSDGALRLIDPAIDSCKKKSIPLSTRARRRKR